MCLSVCVLMGVPVCKRFKCAHVNKRAVLVKRACVANLLKTGKDHVLICTVTENNILTDLKHQNNHLTIFHFINNSGKTKIFF